MQNSAFLKNPLKRVILQSGRGVNQILIIILRFLSFSWLYEEIGSSKQSFSKKCPKQTLRLDFVKLGLKILYFFGRKKCDWYSVAYLHLILTYFFNWSNSSSWKRCGKKLFNVRLGNCLTPSVLHIMQIYWIHKDAIDLISRRKVRFRQTFFQNEVKKCF